MTAPIISVGAVFVFPRVASVASASRRGGTVFSFGILEAGMLNLAIAPLVIAGLAGLLFGVRYMRREAYLPYHAAVAGKAWSELDPGVQIVILCMLRLIGGGFATFGVTILWLCYALHEGVRWAPWAILTVSIFALGPTVYVAAKLRAFRPDANTPVRPTLMLIALILVGVGLSLLA